MAASPILLSGSDASRRAPIPLRAGPLTLLFEPDLAFLRYARLGEREVLRGVYAAVRDRNWGTVAPRVSNLELDDRAEEGFRLAFDVECREGPIDFFWRGTLTGVSDGTVVFGMDGVARSTFLRNRVGFCVLHPGRECAGAPCEVETVDGRRDRSEFPRHISPHQPFAGMAAIAHRVSSGRGGGDEIWAEVRFAGDIFEMEDQRNWTDASFKTYCTPLALPYPVEVKEGTRICQSVTISLRGPAPARPAAEPAKDAPREVRVEDGPARPLPAIGLGIGEPAAREQVALLKALNLSHLRVDLRLYEAGFPQVLEGALDLAEQLGAGLEVALFVTDAARTELDRLTRLPALERARGATWLVFHQHNPPLMEPVLTLARDRLRKRIPDAQVGGGTNAYFTHLNRERPSAEVLDAVCYSVNPQVHAFDNASLVETLETQGTTVASTRELYPDKPIRVTPVTFRPRFNPDATGPEPAPAPGELPASVDARQLSLFGAAWTLGSLKYLAESGAASVTYYETVGWRGVMERVSGSPLPERFPSVPGAVFPLYHVLADAGEYAGGEVLPSTSSAPLEVESLALRKNGRACLLLANMTGAPKRVSVHLPAVSGTARLRVLDGANVEQATRQPEAFRAVPGGPVETSGGTATLELHPYAIVRVDW